MFGDLWFALTALFVSHGISFYTNFLGRGEYHRRNIQAQMAKPYKRVAIMHVTIIFGGGITLMLGTAIPVLLLLIALKIIVDVRAHVKEHVPI